MNIVHLLRKPCSEKTVAGNSIKWGTGALNIDQTRVPHGTDVNLATVQRQQAKSGQTAVSGAFGAESLVGKVIPTYKPGGRWPSNFILQHLPECTENVCREGCPVTIVNQQSGVSAGTGGGASRYFIQLMQGEVQPYLLKLVTKKNGVHASDQAIYRHNENSCHSVWLSEDHEFMIHQAFSILRPGGHLLLAAPDKVGFRGASRAEDAGFEVRDCFCVADSEKDALHYVGKASRSEREKGLGGKGKTRLNVHPTVKPILVMKRLIEPLPSDDLILDPFLGSGTTALAVQLLSRSLVGVEKDNQYFNIARARVTNTSS